MHKVLVGLLGCALVSFAFAGDMATPDEAKALSQKAKTAVNEMGKDKAMAAFADANGGYQAKDLYVFCMSLDGVMLSHPKKPELVGKNLTEFNKYGDFLFKDMVVLAKASGEGWVNYKWPYPGTEEIKAKTSYIAMNKEGFFCGVGAYK
jgi:cytochrome c